MASIIFFIIIAIVIINVIRAVSKQAKAQGISGGPRTNRRMWSEAAYAQNMNMLPPDSNSVFPSLRGMIDGVYVEAWGDFDEKGLAVVFCRVEYALSLPFRLCIVRGGFENDAVGSAFEIRGVSSPEVTVTASDSGELQKFLTPANLNILKNCVGIYHSVKITDSFVVLGAAGINDGLSFNSFIERTVSAAKALSGGHTVEMAPKEQLPIPLADDSQEIFIPGPALKPESDAMTTTSVVPEDAPPPEIVVDTPPAAAQNAEPVAEPEPVFVPEPEPVSPQSQEESVPEQADLSAEGLSAALFSASFPGETEKKYFEQLIGKTVQWSGTLKSVYPYSSDFVFGKGPGAKAVFEIAEVASSYGMKNKVKATVSFGEETLSVLKGQTGKEFTFTGVLLKMDAFSREIMLEKGSLQG